jgi:hypothetical protein
MKTQNKAAAQPTLILTVTQHGVSKITIPYRTLAEEAAGRKLQERCSAIIQLLSQVARGITVPTPSLPIELPPATVITHASNQSHHPRQS